MAACSSALQTTASALGSRQLSVQRQGLRQARSLAQRVRAAQQPNLRPLDASAGRSNGAARAARAASSSSSGTDAPPAAAPKSYRVSPLQTLTFAGPVPERVNGRLAILALMHIARTEMETGQTVLQQAAALPTNYAAWPVAALMLLMVVATFPPALAGAKEEDFGWMSVKAEKTNMRAAMLGLAALTALEWHSGFCFF